MALIGAARYLSGLAKRGIRPSLERIRSVLESCGRPDLSYWIILITGTNGKGTCAKAISEILCSHGLQVGLYTSPHLFSYAERYEINGARLSDRAFEAAVREQRALLESRRVRLTEFEFLTLLAYRIFSKRRVDWAVVEIGMGGRWDATNAADPCLSVITTIGLDHMEFLGRTVSRIAFDKAHIARKNRDLLVGPVPPPARRSIQRVASRIGARPIFLSPQSIRSAVRKFEDGGSRSHPRSAEIFAPSLSTALLAGRKILGSNFQTAKVRSALRRAVLPGRYHQIQVNGHSFLVDVAHNEQAFGTLFRQIRRDFPRRRLQVILGMQIQKRGEREILNHLSATDLVRLVRLSIPRSKPVSAWKPFLIAARRLGVSVAHPAPTRTVIREALRSTRPGDLLVVTGSFYTVREAMAVAGSTFKVQRSTLGIRSLE